MNERIRCWTTSGECDPRAANHTRNRAHHGRGEPSTPHDRPLRWSARNPGTWRFVAPVALAVWSRNRPCEPDQTASKSVSRERISGSFAVYRATKFFGRPTNVHGASSQCAMSTSDAGQRPPVPDLLPTKRSRPASSGRTSEGVVARDVNAHCAAQLYFDFPQANGLAGWMTFLACKRRRRCAARPETIPGCCRAECATDTGRSGSHWCTGLLGNGWSHVHRWRNLIPAISSRGSGAVGAEPDGPGANVRISPLLAP